VIYKDYNKHKDLHSKHPIQPVLLEMSDSKFYACWKPSDGCFKCSEVCMPFEQAQKFLDEKRTTVDTITTLEECKLLQLFVFYGKAAAVIRASNRYNSMMAGKNSS